MYDWIIWLSVAVVLLVIEIMTIDLVAVWFSLSAFVLAIVTAIFPELKLVWQICIFVGLSTILLLSTRKVIKKLMKKRDEQETNLELILNHTAIVKEEINNDLSVGAVKINGIIYSARSIDNSIITVDTLVIVKKISGNKLVVEAK